MNDGFEEDYRFYLVYCSLPFKERQMPCVVVDDEPISWLMACREIEYETELGKRILAKLVELELI